MRSFVVILLLTAANAAYSQDNRCLPIHAGGTAASTIISSHGENRIMTWACGSKKYGMVIKPEYKFYWSKNKAEFAAEMRRVSVLEGYDGKPILQKELADQLARTK